MGKTKKQNQIKANKKSKPAKGDPGYLTPTQLRNRRKRRAKQQKNGSSNTNASESTEVQNDGNIVKSNLPTKSSCIFKDPSMKYISNPKNAPIVQTAKQFFQSIKCEYTVNTINFQVHLGPLYHWRSVSKLAVREAIKSHDRKPKVAIGLFLPQSHTLLPVPNCRAHHPSINLVVDCVTRACHEIEIEPYQEAPNAKHEEHGKQVDEAADANEKGKGQLRYIGVNIERKTGGAQLTLVWNGDAPKVANDDKEEIGGGISNPHLAKLVKKILSMSDVHFSTDTLVLKDASTKGQPGSKGFVSLTIDEQPTKKRRRRGNREGVAKPKDNSNSSAISTASDTTDNNATSSSKKSKLNLHSIWINYNLSWKHSNAIFAYDSSCWKHIYGPPAIIEHLTFGSDNKGDLYAKPPPASFPIPLYFPPNVFRQANLDAFTNIVARIRERVLCLGDHSKHGGQKKSNALPSCIELYGGVGTIGLHLSDIVSSLVSSDENPNNAKCFNESVSKFPPDVQSRLEYKQKNATDMVLSETKLFSKCEVLVVDPPRKGLDEEVINYLCQTTSLQLVVYVSCGFQAFQKDCNAMLDSKLWKLEFAEGYLLFPGSDAIETLAFFVPA